MYSQFIYFIIVIFICATYHPSEKPNFSFAVTVLLFLLLFIVFIGTTRHVFNKLEKNTDREPLPILDRKYDFLVSRQTVFAIILFAADIYLLNIPDFLLTFQLFLAIPTLTAAACIVIFIAYLSIIWKWAHRSYQKIYRNRLSNRSFILSNISLGIPVVLPWIVLSVIYDLLHIIPLEPIKSFLSSPQGEIGYFILSLVVIASIGPYLIQKLWRCKPLEPGHVRNRIEAICKRAGLGFSDILYWPMFGGKMVTAGIMGLVRQFRYILITPSLLKVLDENEMDAVIAHEIGHIKKGHMIFYLLLLIGYSFVSYQLFILAMHILSIWPNGFIFLLRSNIRPQALESTLFVGIYITGFIIYFRFLYGFFMRNFERQADAYVYRLFASARPLISTLEKIALISGLSPEKPNWHHFSIKERISFLEKCETDHTAIIRHDRKIKTTMVLCLVGLISIGATGIRLSDGKIEDNFRISLYEHALIKELETSPQDPMLYRALGDVYFRTAQYDKAQSAYSTSLTISPDNSEALNNFAWLLATCSDPSTKNAKKAIALAKQAVLLDAAPHIYDTLAESYYADRQFEKAIRTGQKALDTAVENRKYYKEQLGKFRMAKK